MRDLNSVRFTDHIPVTLIDSMGGDLSILHAARVSVAGGLIDVPADLLKEGELAGLIGYLMKHRHGTPFEHNAMTLRAHGPIFVFREWHRHRIAWSYSEESGRYKELEGLFHIPAQDRPLINIGTSARPVMAAGTSAQHGRLVDRMKKVYGIAYEAYCESLEEGVAKEVAREVLPVGIYSSMYATCNLRSALSFLSLRTHDPDATYVSYPQWEIEQAARQIEEIVERLFPLAHAAFDTNGRVAP